MKNLSERIENLPSLQPESLKEIIKGLFYTFVAIIQSCFVTSTLINGDFCGSAISADI